jgi:hypothetical protein
MYIVLSILTMFCASGMITFYSGYIACRTSLRKRTQECSELKKELEFTKFQVETLRKEVREEKNKNLVMESLLIQYKK